MIDDPITFEVIKNALISCASEMSHALRRTAFSPNIKERRDCSCAVFDSEGRLVAQSKDIPVHLGAMPMSVRACIEAVGNNLTEGTMALLNDPYSGGSHLPDLTLVAPVFRDGERVAFVANRAHHADVGGISPGSMPGLSTDIHEEGVLIEPRIIVRNGVLQRNTIEDLLRETRTPDERLGDLSAQIAANTVGGRRLHEVMKTHGPTNVLDTFQDLRDYSAERMKNEMMRLDGREGEFTDFMDSDGAGTWTIPISVSLRFKRGHVRVDFGKTSEQVMGNINCPLASTLSAVYYVFIALFGHDVPTNEGCWRVIDVKVPPRSLLNPEYPAAVSAGNVETTQRIVDVVFGALAQIIPDEVPAASQGTMNNLTIGGTDHRMGRAFTFYETIAGGAGAVRGAHGVSGIHTHMTNTLNTPIEALETSYPLRVRKYSIRRGSGGHGKWNGGDGIVREIEILADKSTISIQSERRHSSPWGLAGGAPGAPGDNLLIYGGREYRLQSKSTVIAPAGTVIRIETPGGGGWGAAEDMF
ncbi:MAG: hydantoinase B/oxoprolinase family protein [Candidatus Thorarchaeota archaeon]|nr:MAG: hydantoinase B/oxoprolinase family protein [Candidatus Thorarchaeota archaeon]